jgi:hypothetical protein
MDLDLGEAVECYYRSYIGAGEQDSRTSHRVLWCFP